MAERLSRRPSPSRAPLLVEPYGEPDVVGAKLLGQHRHQLEQGRPPAVEVLCAPLAAPSWCRLYMHNIRRLYVNIVLALLVPVYVGKLRPQYPGLAHCHTDRITLVYIRV